MAKRRRKRGRLKNEANYLYHPSSQSFKGYIKIQSVIPRHPPPPITKKKKEKQLVELCLCVREWIHVCSYMKKCEAHFGPLLLRLAAGKVCNEELPALTFMLWLSAAPPLYLRITKCPLCAPHHYGTEVFTLTSEYNHPPQNRTNHGSFLNQVFLAAYRCRFIFPSCGWK